MASLYPERPEIRTNGESRLISFLKNEMDHSWNIYYEPFINEKQPDLVLFSEHYGVIVIEVKDYKKETIQSITPNTWEISITDKKKSVNSPFIQAKKYAYDLIDLLSREQRLLQIGKTYSGKLKFPVIPLCFFSNLTMNELKELKIISVIPESYVITFDLLAKVKIKDIVHQLFSKYFIINPMSESEGNLVKEIIFPKFNYSMNCEKNKVNLSNRRHEENGYDKVLTDKKRELHNQQRIVIYDFDTYAEEFIFVATEIRHLLNKGVNPSDIIVGFYKDRIFRGISILEEISSIFSEMGVVSSIAINSSSVRIIPINRINEVEYKIVFLVDLNSIRRDEEKKSVLTIMSKIRTQKKIYISFNVKTIFTNLLMEKF